MACSVSDFQLELEAHDDGEYQSVQPDSSGQDNPNKKVKTSSTSEVWKYFTKVGKVDGKRKATCNGCGESYIVGGKEYETSTLLRHVNMCESIPKCEGIRARQIDHNKFRELISMAIIKHDLPYSFVEYDGIRDIFKYLNPNCKHITRKTAMVDVWNVYLSQKENLKEMIGKSRSRVCLTSYYWTSVNSEGYLCLSAHFVDEKWKLNSKILAFSKVEPPSSGFELARRAYDILADWGIEKKLFSITLENTSANDSMQNVLKWRLNLSNSLICNGEFFHVQCCAQILNLIVQESLNMTSEAIHKIRESIRYVRQTEETTLKFKRCVEQVGGADTSVGLRLDVPTRWNLTHAMLKSALKYRRAFVCLAFDDSHYHHCPTNEEWSRIDEICTFLEPFAVISNLISESSYPTSNMYFILISQIETKLKKNVHNDDVVIQDMAVRMLDKFEKYWSDYSVILALAVILDPRMKFDVIKFAYSELDPVNCNKKIENIRSKLYYIFNEYKDVGSSPSSVPFVGSESSSNVNVSRTAPPISTCYSITNKDMNLIAFGDYLEYKSKDTTTIKKSELDYYLEEGTLDPNLFVELNVLDYWKTNSTWFPCLSKMACDILSIPITTVAGESAFSIGSRVLTKYRSCLLPENVQALICTRNWILGFPWNEEFVEKESVDVSRASDDASNIIIEDD